MRIWGITGTNGKTTTTWILSEFLKAAYITTVEVNTLSRRFSTGYTTPPLGTLKDIFSEMKAAGANDCVMEVSSHAIAQRRTGDTVFSGGAFTNLSEDHLDYHKTMEEYFRVKLLFAERIAQSFKALPTHGRRDMPPFVVCLDGGYAGEMLEAVGRLPLNVIPITRKHPKYDLSRLQLVGDYNESNVLVAAALAEAAGVPHDAIQNAIPSLAPRWGRLEHVSAQSAADVYIDFAHTPDGLEKVLTAARGFTKGRIWVVFGAGGNRDTAKRPMMGDVARALADRVVVTSDNPRGEDPTSIIASIYEGVRNCTAPRADMSNVYQIVDRAEAIDFALRHARRGDVVLVCGKGHETTQEINGIKYPFDDREVVRNFKL